MNQPEKKHCTVLRILEVLKILLEKDVSRQELLENLKKKAGYEEVYSNEVILKYFNTFELLGLKLRRDKNLNGLENALLQIELSKSEYKMLHKLISSVKKLNNKSEEEIISSLIYKIDKYIPENIIAVLNNSMEKERFIHNTNVKENVIHTLKDMIYDNQNVNITYINKSGEEETSIFEIKEIIEQKKDIVIVCYDSKMGRNRKISINAIKEMKQSPKKASGVSMLNSVVFEVYGRLASLYKLKPSEKVINFSNNHITISNTEEDKDVLIHRLIKYGENCRIIRPQSVQNEFLELTDNILKNLEAS